MLAFQNEEIARLTGEANYHWTFEFVRMHEASKDVIVAEVSLLP